MTELSWDQPGERRYELGVDRGVLYLLDAPAVAWNGLISVEDIPSRELKEYFHDGVKFLDHVVPGQFAGKLKAFTYPDEFETLEGAVRDPTGLMVHDQSHKRFGLSYRTKLGDDLVGMERGYKIHMLYNLSAIPDSNVFTTIGSDIVPMEFSWSLSSIPTQFAGYRPTAHLSVNSTDMDEEALYVLERILYGTDAEDPRLPSIEELHTIIQERAWDAYLTDHGDGTWSIVVDSTQVTMSESDTAFEINDVNATYTDDDTYILVDDA